MMGIRYLHGDECSSVFHGMLIIPVPMQARGVLSHVHLFVTPRTVACQALYPWNFLGKNTGVGSHFLPQRIDHSHTN